MIILYLIFVKNKFKLDCINHNLRFGSLFEQKRNDNTPPPIQSKRRGAGYLGSYYPTWFLGRQLAGRRFRVLYNFTDEIVSINFH